MSRKSVVSHAISVESLLDELALKAQLIFEHLDEQGRGYLEPWQLAQACDTEIAKGDLEEILHQLDADGDGLINFEDFYKAFQQIVRRQSFYSSSDEPLTGNGRSRINSSASSQSGSRHRLSNRQSLGQLSNRDSTDDDRYVFKSVNLQKRASLFRRIKARSRQRQLLRQRSSSSFSVMDSLEGAGILRW